MRVPTTATRANVNQVLRRQVDGELANLSAVAATPRAIRVKPLQRSWPYDRAWNGYRGHDKWTSIYTTPGRIP